MLQKNGQKLDKYTHKSDTKCWLATLHSCSMTLHSFGKLCYYAAHTVYINFICFWKKMFLIS